MNRIEEIKERADKEEYVKCDIKYYEAQEDIQYLLSRLEIAEKSLNRLYLACPPSALTRFNTPEELNEYGDANIEAMETLTDLKHG